MRQDESTNKMDDALRSVGEYLLGAMALLCLLVLHALSLLPVVCVMSVIGGIFFLVWRNRQTASVETES